MKRNIAQLTSALLLGGCLFGVLGAAQPADAQSYRYRSSYADRMSDFDRDGIPNHRDRDIDNDGVNNARDRNDYSRTYRSRVGGWRNTYRTYDWDGDGVRNSRDRHPRNPRRR